ncbi:hypothetical protein SFRURICE_016139 [Spodoptera frugiperda]|nr:hypothetical protein SFRURICE_016139 [Spodoptera frugiperda]
MPQKIHTKNTEQIQYKSPKDEDGYLLELEPDPECSEDDAGYSLEVELDPDEDDECLMTPEMDTDKSDIAEDAEIKLDNPHPDDDEERFLGELDPAPDNPDDGEGYPCREDPELPKRLEDDEPPESPDDDDG